MNLYAWKSADNNVLVYTDTTSPTTSSTLYKSDGSSYSSGEQVHFYSSSNVVRATITGVNLSSNPEELVLATGIAGAPIT